MATHRVTARVLPVSPGGEVLLLQDQDPARPGVLRWGSIGGGVDPDESLVDAARRELHEETGLVAGPEQLIGPFLRSPAAYSFAGVDYEGDHTYFALALGREAEVGFEHLAPDEVDTVVAAGWWTPSDLVAHGVFLPLDLPDIMRAAIVAVGGEQ